MNALYALMEKTSQKTTLLILVALLVILNILMNAPGLPTSTPSMQEISPTFTPFDLQAKGYTIESFTEDLQTLGESGRNIYRNFMLCDIVFPAVYGLTFSSLIFLVFRSRNTRLSLLFLVPLLTGLMDYIENVFIAIAFAGYPSSSPSTVTMASIATQAKMVCNVILVLSLLFTLATWLISLFRKESSTKRIK